MTRIRVIFLLLALLPFPVVKSLSDKYRRYDEVLRQTPRIEDCTPELCKIDFDGDGTASSVFLDEGSSAEYYDSSLVIVEGGREILRVPYAYMDNTFRTHTGIRSGKAGPRLVVYNGINSGSAPVNAVYAWNGSALAPVQPENEDLELLAAMSSRDDSGTFHTWIAYRALRIPILTFYFVVWALVVCLLIRRQKRRTAFS